MVPIKHGVNKLFAIRLNCWYTVDELTSESSVFYPSSILTYDRGPLSKCSYRTIPLPFACPNVFIPLPLSRFPIPRHHLPESFLEKEIGSNVHFNQRNVHFIHSESESSLLSFRYCPDLHSHIFPPLLSLEMIGSSDPILFLGY